MYQQWNYICWKYHILFIYLWWWKHISSFSSPCSYFNQLLYTHGGILAIWWLQTSQRFISSKLNSNKAMINSILWSLPSRTSLMESQTPLFRPHVGQMISKSIMQPSSITIILSILFMTPNTSLYQWTNTERKLKMWIRSVFSKHASLSSKQTNKASLLKGDLWPGFSYILWGISISLCTLLLCLMTHFQKEIKVEISST